MALFTNTSDRIVHVDGKMIHPGETREVGPLGSPPQARPVGFDDLHDLSDKAAGTVDLADLLKGSVAKVAAALTSLDEAQLEALAELEYEDGAPRKGVIEAVEAEKLRRAAASLEGGEA